MSRIKTVRCYVILNVTDPFNIHDEDFVYWNHRTDEELKKEAFQKKREFEEKYIDEKFKVILREEFEEDVEEKD